MNRILGNLIRNETFDAACLHEQGIGDSYAMKLVAKQFRVLIPHKEPPSNGLLFAFFVGTVVDVDF